MKPKQLAGCVIYNAERELLLLHRKTRELSQWELPGGKFEGADDTLQDTAERELFEELGVRAERIVKQGSVHFFQATVEFAFEWFEVEIEGKPYIRERHLFDALRFWDVQVLAERTDISPNVRNLLQQLGV